MTSNFRKIVLLGACCAPLLLSGCLVSTSSKKDGKNNDNVSIATPFGSMHVKTNDSADKIGIGLSVYPGAVPTKDGDNDKDKNAADINLSFGDFHLGVKAASYQTSDSPAKVEAFYRKDMAKYGDVIKCQGDNTIGQPTRTAQGLTCKDSKDNHITAGSDDKKGMHIHGTSSSDNPELRAGSPSHQHIVGIEPKNGGTKIGLVMLDLPHDHDSHDGDKSE